MVGGMMEALAPKRVKLNRKGNHDMLLRKALEEVNLHQLVRDKMAEMRCDFITLCRVAHIKQFQTDPDQTQSYINWVQHGICPVFLEQWLNEQ